MDCAGLVPASTSAQDFDLSQDPNTSKILELMAPIAPANMDREAYADGELVLYNSEPWSGGGVMGGR